MKLFLSKLHYEKNPAIYKKVIIAGLSLCAVPYSVITSVRNFLYDKNIMKSKKPENALVISVGNLTTGGVGKTPFTAEIANLYISKGKKVAILSRGYGGSLPNKDVNVISDGKKIYFSAEQSGDEPFWLASNCPSVVVLTCSSRVKSAEYAVKNFGCEVLIADDAFQHRKLARDKNLVLIDSKNKFGNGRHLPAGPLRESFSGINRATALVVTNKSLEDENALKYCDEVKSKFNKPVFLCKMLPDKAYDIRTSEPLQQASVASFCAIGQPLEFFNFVRNSYNVMAEKEFPDHYSYTEKDVENLIKLAEENGVNSLVTTEKDAVKIKDIFAKFKTTVRIYALKLKACADFEDILNAG